MAVEPAAEAKAPPSRRHNLSFSRCSAGKLIATDLSVLLFLFPPPMPKISLIHSQPNPSLLARLAPQFQRQLYLPIPAELACLKGAHYSYSSSAETASREPANQWARSDDIDHQTKTSEILAAAAEVGRGVSIVCLRPHHHCLFARVTASRASISPASRRVTIFGILTRVQLTAERASWRYPRPVHCDHHHAKQTEGSPRVSSRVVGRPVVPCAVQQTQLCILVLFSLCSKRETHQEART